MDVLNRSDPARASLREGQSVKAAMGLALLVMPTLAAAQEHGAFDKEICATSYERAQVLLREHRLVDAKKDLSECKAICPSVLAGDCEKWSVALEKATPTIVVVARDAHGQALHDVRVDVDGQRFAERIDEQPRPIDPGTHTFRFEMPSLHFERVVNLRIEEGEKGRSIVVIVPVATEPPPVPVLPPAPNTLPSPRRAPPPPLLSYVFGGVGLGALAVGSTLVIDGEVRRLELASTCGQTAEKCAHPEVQAIRTLWTIGGVTLGAAAVSLGVATGLFLSARASATPKRRQGLAWDIALSPRRIDVLGTF